MNADDFQELYKLIRGSRSALAVLDSRALFLDMKMVAAHEKLLGAREQYADGRSRLVKQDVEQQVDAGAKDAARQVKRLKRKKEKVIETLETFDELLQQLEKAARRERARKEKEAAAVSRSADEGVTRSTPERDSQDHDASVDPALVVARPSDISRELVRAFSDSHGDERFDVISRSFGFREVRSEEDIHGDSLYLIHTGANSFLVRTPAAQTMTESFALVSIVDDRPMPPFTREAFLELGERRKMVLLTKNAGVKGAGLDRVGLDGVGENGAGLSSSRMPVGESLNESETLAGSNSVSGSSLDQRGSVDSETPGQQGGEEDAELERSILDRGAFGQLLTTAQRCGLVQGADQIAHVRDREFRMGKYDLAFQSINALHSTFQANANQRVQRLNREEADISSGRVKVSPKQLQAKRARDRAQTQEIERAKRRFQVVLEGLRVLMQPA